MVTMVGKQKNKEDLVSSLLNLEHDAIEAYDATIKRLKAPDLVQQISAFKQDHLRHIEELARFAGEYGIDMPDGTMKSILTKGKIVIADMGGDDAILGAMKTNEFDTVSAYENALENDYLSPALRQCCEHCLADEIRHRDWMDQMSKQLKAA